MGCSTQLVQNLPDKVEILRRYGSQIMHYHIIKGVH